MLSVRERNRKKNATAQKKYILVVWEPRRKKAGKNTNPRKQHCIVIQFLIQSHASVPKWPGALIEYWRQTHRTLPLYPSQKKREKSCLSETAGDEALTLPEADTNVSERLTSM